MRYDFPLFIFSEIIEWYTVTRQWKYSQAMRLNCLKCYKRNDFYEDHLVSKQEEVTGKINVDIQFLKLVEFFDPMRQLMHFYFYIHIVRK